MGENEDSLGGVAARNVWFVADGMGGHGHGQVASSIVRDYLEQTATADNLMESIKGAHAAVLAAVAADPLLDNMGSTVVAAALVGSRCRIAWVGDSRAYRFSAERLEQVSVDHSVRQLLLAQGEVEPAQIDARTDGDILVRALGMEVFDPSCREVALRKGDRILLCSDGLTREVSDEDIRSILSRGFAPQAAADALVSQALANGGRDNVSAIVIAYDGPDDPSLQAPVPARIFLPLVGGALAAIAMALAWAWWSGQL